MKFVDVKNDVAFRKVFGNENRKEILNFFLNAILQPASAHRIVDVEILTPYQLPAIKGGKVTIVDVKARDQSGKNYIVEMQVAEVEGFDKRVLYYASKSYSAQIERGDIYEKLNPIFSIGILDFEITKNPGYLSRHKILDLETGENVVSDIEFNFIELPKFNKVESELKTTVDKWIYFMKKRRKPERNPRNGARHGPEKRLRGCRQTQLDAGRAGSLRLRADARARRTPYLCASERRFSCFSKPPFQRMRIGGA